MHGSPCPYCKGKAPPNFDRVCRLTAYVEPVRRVVHHLKYHRRWTLGEELADRLIARQPVRQLLSESDVLIPVPLHWRRQVPRGYNQAEVIARRLAARSDGPKVLRAVKRVRHTPQQTRLHSPTHRAENLKDAFRLAHASRLEGKRVVLVDDVWTTGATMQAVARTVKPAHPASISAVVVAVANPRGVESRTPAGPIDVELDP
jgi:ComF family protein